MTFLGGACLVFCGAQITWAIVGICMEWGWRRWAFDIVQAAALLCLGVILLK
jgi:hypothetical protein